MVFSIVIVLLSVTALAIFYLQNIEYRSRIEHLDELVSAQENLIDSLRGSSAGFRLANLIDRIDRELHDRQLDEETIRHIAAFSNSLNPYYFRSGDTLSRKPVSPERGQLLIYLHNLQLDTTTLNEIAEAVIFEYADLRGTDLRNAYLRNFKLRFADLQDAILDSADLSNTDLREANLWGIKGPNTILNESQLNRSDMRWADLTEAKLRKANLNGVNLSSARLRRADLTDAKLQYSDISYASLLEADMPNINMLGTNTYGIDLRNSNVVGGHLRLINFIEVSLQGANLTGVYLAQATVPDTSWFEWVEEREVIGIDSIRIGYDIVRIKENGTPRFELALKD